MALSTLMVVQWNAQGLNSKISEVKNFIYEKQPHIVAICETWLNKEIDYVFKNYHRPFRKDRPNRQRGGIAFLVRRDLQTVEFELHNYQNGKLEYLATSVAFSNGWHPIVMFYNPCLNVTTNEFVHYFDQLPSKSLVLGDFNARHPFWEPNIANVTINTSGRSLYNALFDTELALLTPLGLPTRFDPYNCKLSTLDLSMGSGFFSRPTSVELGPHLGGDHLPIIIKYNSAPNIESIGRRSFWNFKKGTWKDYADVVTGKLQSANVSESDIHTANEQICTSLVEAGKEVFQLKKGALNNKIPKPWWNEECSLFTARRRKALRYWKKHPGRANQLAFRKAEAEARKIHKASKKKSWRDYVSTLSFSSTCSKTWKFFKKMVGQDKPFTFPLKDAGTLLTTSLAKSEILADHYYSILGSAPLLQEHRLYSSVIDRCLSEGAMDDDSINLNFSGEELDRAVNILKLGKCPGPDYVTNEMIKVLTDPQKQLVLDMFNKSWVEGHLPNSWKEADILPIPKPGKDLTIAASYRPISLLSCMGKLMEKMVNTRLQWWLESSYLLPSSQCGFRPGRCTIDCLVQLEHIIQLGYRSKKYTLVVFFDIDKAFDAAPHISILYKLCMLGLGGNILAWVNDFLQNRTFSVCVGDARSSQRNVRSGVPQGAVLSPTLFSILMYDVPNHESCTNLIYADDVSLVVSAGDLCEAQTLLQASVERFTAWASLWGLSVNGSKSRLMCFTWNKIRVIPNIMCDGSAIPYVGQHTFLGLRFDGPNLTWKEHIKYLKKASMKRIDIMKRVSGTSWGSDRETQIRFYLSFIRSKLDYGYVVYGSASQSQLKTLEVIQNAALRIALGAFRSSPIVSLQCESDIFPLDVWCQALLVRWLRRVQGLSLDHPVFQLLTETHHEVENTGWATVPYRSPFVWRAQMALAALGIFGTMEDFNPIEPISPIPPWSSMSNIICFDIAHAYKKSEPAELAVQLVNELLANKYENYSKIYTDGSLKPDPTPATSAAIYISELEVSFGWKLNPNHSITSAELFAIYQALLFGLNNLKNQSVLVLTDSLSSLHLISTRHPTSSHRIVYCIQCLIKKYQELSQTIRILWIPSHVGIFGNECADLAAKANLNSPSITQYYLSVEDARKNIKSKCRHYWYTKRKALLVDTHLGHVKAMSTDDPSPCARSQERKMDTALTRLRIGHTRLNHTLYKIKIKDDPDCEYPLCCGLVEDVHHVMIDCRRYERERRI